MFKYIIFVTNYCTLALKVNIVFSAENGNIYNLQCQNFLEHSQMNVKKHPNLMKLKCSVLVPPIGKKFKPSHIIFTSLNFMKLSLWRHEQKFDEVIVRYVLMKVLGASSTGNTYP